jgi:hypothetical protein
MDTGVSNVTNGGYALAIDHNNNVYVGGDFVDAGSGPTTVNYIAKWDGSSWSALDSGTNASVRAIVIDDSGILYAGGGFTTASGTTVNKVAAWTGSGWYALGETGVGGGTHGYALALHEGLLWLGGDFTSAGGLDLGDLVAIWNGTAFVHVDLDLPGSPSVTDIIATSRKAYQNIYLAFTTTGSTAYSVDTTVTNNGTANAYPIVVVWNEGGASNTGLTWLKNEETGATVWMDYTLQPEEKVTIDFNPQRFSCVSNYFGDVGYTILNGSDTDFYLLPGTNVITCFTPDASVTAGMYWRIPYWSADGVAS